MIDLQNHSQHTSAARPDFNERSARRFEADPTPPSPRKFVHWRTVADPFEGYWGDDTLPLLDKDSALQAFTLLRHPLNEHPLAFTSDCIRRTLQRQLQALKGLERDIIYHQTPNPRYMALSGFAHANELPVPISIGTGVNFRLKDRLDHKLYCTLKTGRM